MVPCFTRCHASSFSSFNMHQTRCIVYHHPVFQCCFLLQLFLHSLQKLHNQWFITIQCVNSSICFKRSFVHPRLTALLVYHHPLIQWCYILSSIFQLPQVIIHNNLSWSSFSIVTCFMWFFPYTRSNKDHLRCEHIVFQSWNTLQVVLRSLHVKYIIYLITFIVSVLWHISLAASLTLGQTHSAFSTI